MKNFLIITVAIMSMIFFAGCSDSSSPASDPNVSITGELATSLVTMDEAGNTDGQILANEVDSIKIIRVRILMSRMMMFVENDNSTSGEVVKLEPFVYDLSLTGGASVLGNHDVPAGMYDKIKIEIHRFNSSELNEYDNEPEFADFATSDRHTILIEGVTYTDENPSTFIFKSNKVANLMLKLEPSLNLENGSVTSIVVEVDPNFFFKKWESILDPNDPNNANDIENTLINTIKAFKKQN